MCLLCAIHFHGFAKNIQFYNLHITFLQEDKIKVLVIAVLWQTMRATAF